MDKNTPALPTAEPIDIGTHGYVKGSLFYLGLTYKRVKGKIRVRGPRKNGYIGKENSFSVAEWQGDEGKAERTRKKERYEKRNKKAA
jgi:hypothetical protein